MQAVRGFAFVLLGQRRSEHEKENKTEEDDVPQPTNKRNVTRWLLSPSAVTVNSGQGKMSKMFSCA